MLRPRSCPYLEFCLICPLLPEPANSPLNRKPASGAPPGSVYPGAKGVNNNTSIIGSIKGLNKMSSQLAFHSIFSVPGSKSFTHINSSNPHNSPMREEYFQLYFICSKMHIFPHFNSSETGAHFIIETGYDLQKIAFICPTYFVLLVGFSIL